MGLPAEDFLLICSGYFFGLHLLGVICLLPWIHRSDVKYRDYLASQGQGATWWYETPFDGMNRS